MGGSVYNEDLYAVVTEVLESEMELHSSGLNLCYKYFTLNKSVICFLVFRSSALILFMILATK